MLGRTSAAAYLPAPPPSVKIHVRPGSHVLPALIHKFHQAKLVGRSEVTIWGSGTPRREFMHVDDLTSACLFLLENYQNSSTINIGTGEDLTIANLAELVREVVYPEAKLHYEKAIN